MNIKKLTTPRFGVKYTNKKDVVVRKQQKGKYLIKGKYLTKIIPQNSGIFVLYGGCLEYIEYIEKDLNPDGSSKIPENDKWLIEVQTPFIYDTWSYQDFKDKFTHTERTYIVCTECHGCGYVHPKNMNWFTALSFKNTCYTCYGAGSWYEEPELETELETELNNEKL